MPYIFIYIYNFTGKQSITFIQKVMRKQKHIFTEMKEVKF